MSQKNVQGWIRSHRCSKRDVCAHQLSFRAIRAIRDFIERLAIRRESPLFGASRFGANRRFVAPRDSARIAAFWRLAVPAIRDSNSPGEDDNGEPLVQGAGICAADVLSALGLWCWPAALGGPWRWPAAAHKATADLQASASCPPEWTHKASARVVPADPLGSATRVAWSAPPPPRCGARCHKVKKLDGRPRRPPGRCASPTRPCNAMSQYTRRPRSPRRASPQMRRPASPQTGLSL